ncbi:MAG: hypothetical protein AAF333_00445 [Planctomycetota bacterium]
MSVVRLNKFEQQLLQEACPGLPDRVKQQTAGRSVRDVSIDQRSIIRAVRMLDSQLAGCGCKATRRRLQRLRDKLFCGKPASK